MAELNRLFDRDVVIEIKEAWEAYVPKILRLAASEDDNRALQVARSTVAECASDGMYILISAPSGPSNHRWRNGEGGGGGPNWISRRGA